MASLPVMFTRAETPLEYRTWFSSGAEREPCGGAIQSGGRGSTEWCGIHHKKGRRGRAGRCGVFPQRLVRLSYLAPDIAQAILDGRQPRDLTADKLLAHSRLPLAWHEQQSVLGFV